MVQPSVQGGHTPDRQIRNLTPAPRQWKVVGLELADQCTFCGAPSEATVRCPDEAAPLIFQVGVCSHCLTDAVMARFAEVKAARTAQLGMDMSAASDAIVTERRKFHAERNRRRQVAHYQILTNAPRRQESAAEHELERQRRSAKPSSKRKRACKPISKSGSRRPLRGCMLARVTRPSARTPLNPTDCSAGRIPSA
jgi:hypothetical protein